MAANFLLLVFDALSAHPGEVLDHFAYIVSQEMSWDNLVAAHQLTGFTKAKVKGAVTARQTRQLIPQTWIFKIAHFIVSEHIELSVQTMLPRDGRIFNGSARGTQISDVTFSCLADPRERSRFAGKLGHSHS